jgi:uncharacterized protein (TIGR00299 family) protein
MTTSVWIDPAFGASGDMLLGAFAGLLDDPTSALAPLDDLGLDGWSIEIGTTIRNGLAAHRVVVDAQVRAHGRHWSSIDRMLAESDLPERVAAGARDTFRRLGEVEAAQHGVDIDEVHFHEVGAVDAIVDIVGVWLLVHALEGSRHGLDAIIVAPVGLGYGTVSAAHGTLPLPAPATLALLEGVDVFGLDFEGETCTPTGAALLVTLATAWGRVPAGRPHRIARGAGGRDPDGHPNVVTAVLVENELVKSGASSGPGFVASSLIETNIDDVSPEVLAHVITRLLAEGADDAWVVPIVMKKGRPAHEVRVLCRNELAASLRSVLATETGSLGSRTLGVQKQELLRTTESVMVRGAAVSMKVGPHGAKPEHDQLVALSAETGVSLQDLAFEAQAAYRQR